MSRAESKKNAAMSKDNFPTGWDENKVRRVVTDYEAQTEEQALAEDEAGVAPSETVMMFRMNL